MLFSFYLIVGFMLLCNFFIFIMLILLCFLCDRNYWVVYFNFLSFYIIYIFYVVFVSNFLGYLSNYFCYIVVNVLLFDTFFKINFSIFFYHYAMLFLVFVFSKS